MATVSRAQLPCPPPVLTTTTDHGQGNNKLSRVEWTDGPKSTGEVCIACQCVMLSHFSCSQPTLDTGPAILVPFTDNAAADLVRQYFINYLFSFIQI